MDRSALKIFRGLRPPPRTSIADWADQHRILSREGAAEPGRWRTDRAPYQREVMDVVLDPKVRTIVWKKSAQVGATEVLNNILGYMIAVRPGPMLVIHPTIVMGGDWSRDRLAPMIRDTPVLSRLVATRRSPEGSSNIHHKSYPGGQVAIVGANAPAGLASRPIAVVLADEIDRWPTSAGGEGDPLDLARKRTATFPDSKILVVSTPTLAGHSRIDTEYELSDKRRFFVPCPDCGTFQTLDWKRILYEPDKPETARYQCSACGVLHGESAKHEMLARGEWRATAIPENPGTVGFHINELYSPWSTWVGVVASRLAAEKKGSESLQVWTNVVLGEVWEHASNHLDANAIAARAEAYTVLPDAVNLVTAGVDVQGDRLEVLVKGWGVAAESWVAEHHIIYGDPEHSNVWKDLDNYLRKKFDREDGKQLAISATCIDSGYLTSNVYAFCAPRWSRRIFATKGVGGAGRPAVSRPTTVKGKVTVKRFPIGTDDAKDKFYARLATDEHGPAFQHYPDTLGSEFFEQLTSEARETKFNPRTGKSSSGYVKIQERNEALDLEVLNLAAQLIIMNDGTRTKPPKNNGGEKVYDPRKLKHLRK